MRRLSTSIVIVSPVRSAAIGPPWTASGAMWPAMKPWLAPEKRPSVISATLSPRPSPMIAAVTASISRMPGPPAGPSLRITTMSSGSISLASTALIAASSPSKTFAGPTWCRRSWPASLMTEPSGATLPLMIAKPPVALSGSSSAWTTTWPGVSTAASAISPAVWPVTVIASACSRAVLSEALEDDRHAAGGVEVGRVVSAARREVAQHRRRLADAVELVDLERDAHLLGDREQVQDRVGRAAAHRDGGDRVLQPLLGDDVARAQAASRARRARARRRRARPRAFCRPRPEPSPSRRARCRAPRRPSPSCWR